MKGDKILCIQKAAIASLKEALLGELEVFAFLHPKGLEQNYAYITSIMKERQSVRLDKMVLEICVCINQNTSKMMLETLAKIEHAFSLQEMCLRIEGFELIGAMTAEARVSINKSGIFEGVLQQHFLLEG